LEASVEPIGWIRDLVREEYSVGKKPNSWDYEPAQSSKTPEDGEVGAPLIFWPGPKSLRPMVLLFEQEGVIVGTRGWRWMIVYTQLN